MAKFYEPLPYSIEVGKKSYKLTPAFDNVLNMYEAIENVSAMEQAELILYYLTDGAPVTVEALEAVIKAYFPEKKKTEKSRAFDFIQDSEYIYAAFWQAYKIDLIEEQGRLHWWKFSALLNGLPSGTKFSDIIQIRLREVPKPTKHNSKERAELLRLKSEFALKISDDERQQNLQRGFSKMAQALLSMAKK